MASEEGTPVTPTVDSKMMALDQINPAAYNPREISKEAMEALEASIDTYGLVENLVFNKRTGNLVGGHQRYKVLKKRNVLEAMTNIIDVDEDTEKELNITLNNPNVQGQYVTAAALKIMEQIKLRDKKRYDKMRMNALEKNLPLFEGNVDEKFSEGKAEVPAGGPVEVGITKSNVKLIQLFLTEATHPVFIARCSDLAQELGTENLTDTIEKVIGLAHSSAFPDKYKDEKLKETVTAS